MADWPRITITHLSHSGTFLEDECPSTLKDQEGGRCRSEVSSKTPLTTLMFKIF